MADEKDLEKEIESIIGSSMDLRKVFEDQMRVNRSRFTSEEAQKKASLKTIKDIIDAQRNLKKSAEELHISIDGLKKKFNEGELTADELKDELEDLRNQVARTTDADKKAALIKAKSELESANARAQGDQIVRKSMAQMSGVAIAGAITAYTSAAKAALSGGDAFSVAGAFMEGNIDSLNNTVQVGAKGLMDFGAATAGAGGRVGKFGLAASVAGAAVSFLSTQVSELAKAGIGFLMRETPKLITGFQQMSASGAVFAGGMREMIGTANGAGLTLEQFSKAVDANKDKLAAMGLGIGEASKRMAGAMKAGGAEAQKQLFSLGMSAEQQADAYATVMQRLAGPTQRLKASNEEVAAATLKYATDLKTLQSLTGEDVKSKQDKIRQENDTLAFQQELAKMAPEKAAALQAAMDNMTEGQRKALRERMIYGAVISKDVAIGMATNEGIRKNHEMTYQAAMDGSLNAQKMQDIQSRTNAEITKNALDNVGLARGQSEAAQAGAKENLDQMKYAGKFNKEALEAARNNVEGTKTSGGGGAADLMKIQQDFAVKMQEIAAKNLPAFSDAVKQTIKDIEGAVTSFAEGGIKAGTGLNGLVNVLAIGVPLISAAMQMMAMKGGGMGGGGGGGKGMMGKLGGFGKIAKGIGGGIGGLLGGAALSYGADAARASGHEKIGAGADVASDALTYGGMGATIGSVIPGIGTAVGAGVGALGGAAYGLYKNWGTLKGGDQPSPTSNATMSAATPAISSAADTTMTNLTELVSQNKTIIDAQKAMVGYMREMRDYQQKLLHAST